MALSRFDAATRRRVQSRYVDAIEPWREGDSYRLPGEFVVLVAKKPAVWEGRLEA